MAIALSVLLWGGLGVLAGAAGYLWMWAVIGLCLPRKRPLLGRSLTPFLVLVPAHNEESRLPDLLKSLAAQDHSAHDTWVIADNCTDGTAAAAAAAGARCLVRTDRHHPGKGQALQFAFSHLDESDAEAVVILDADSLVNPQFLSALAASLSEDPAGRALVRQASSRLRPGDSAQSLLLAAESALEDRSVLRLQRARRISGAAARRRDVLHAGAAARTPLERRVSGRGCGIRDLAAAGGNRAAVRGGSEGDERGAGAADAVRGAAYTLGRRPPAGDAAACAGLPPAGPHPR